MNAHSTAAVHQSAPAVQARGRTGVQVQLWVAVRAAAVVVCAVLHTGCATQSPNYQNQIVFSSPELAVESLAEAVRVRDRPAVEAIFGPEAVATLSSGDPIADKASREVFAVALAEQWRLERIDGNTRELVVGYEEWPFPIPLQKDARGWWFDTVAGTQEVLARRVGRNELAAIGVCRTYVLAQLEYAAEGRDGKPSGIFAQKVRSDPGTRNGLHWASTGAGAKPSPLGSLAAAASADGYTAADPRAERTPFYGYYYRILTRQGSNAPGGASDYIVNGEMNGGFALVAWPAEYGNSGVMTFMVGRDGVVYETDLGADTTKVVSGINEFDPGDEWRIVE